MILNLPFIEKLFAVFLFVLRIVMKLFVLLRIYYFALRLLFRFVELSTHDVFPRKSSTFLFVEQHPAYIEDSAVFFCITGIYALVKFSGDIMGHDDLIEVGQSFFQEVRAVGIGCQLY